MLLKVKEDFIRLSGTKTGRPERDFKSQIISTESNENNIFWEGRDHEIYDIIDYLSFNGYILPDNGPVKKGQTYKLSIEILELD